MKPTARPQVNVLPNEVRLNGIQLHRSEPPSVFYEFLGAPNKVGSTTPAPFGHRNNQFHYYDDLGITLNEHHYTRQVSEINFVFDVVESDHPTSIPYTGDFQLNQLQVSEGTLESELPQSGLHFTSRLGGSWNVKVPTNIDREREISVWVRTVGLRLKSGRRSKRKRIVKISLCLQHDPWDATFAE